MSAPSTNKRVREHEVSTDIKHAKLDEGYRDNIIPEESPTRSKNITSASNAIALYNVTVPDNIESCREELQRQIESGLNDIEESSEIVSGLNQLSTGRGLEQLTSQCGKLLNWWSYRDLYKCLQKQLNLTFDIMDKSRRREEFDTVLIYFLMQGNESDEQKLAFNFVNSLYDTDSWYELCCAALGNEKTFTKFYKQLDTNNAMALQYLIYKQPQLLFQKNSHELMPRLIENLPYDHLHQLLRRVQSKDGQTYMFCANNHVGLVEMYTSHIDDLYELLSLRNDDGETALHVNAKCITDLLADTYTRELVNKLYELLSKQNNQGQTALHKRTYCFAQFLADIYTPKQRDVFREVTSIKDEEDKTAQQLSNIEMLSSLIRRVENNNYVMWNRFDFNILIIYNSEFGTSSRQGADQEARNIYNACRTIYGEDNITLEKNKTSKQLIQLITQSASKKNRYGKLPKSLIVILASHGSNGAIADCDGKLIEVAEIERAMSCDSLDGRPKMLITQFCQNTTQECLKLKPYTPTHSDFCVVMSSVSSEKSKRGVFLGQLAEKIKNCAHNTNIFKLVNSVSKEMERDGHKQTPIVMSTLKAELCPTDEWGW